MREKKPGLEKITAGVKAWMALESPTPGDRLLVIRGASLHDAARVLTWVVDDIGEEKVVTWLAENVGRELVVMSPTGEVRRLGIQNKESPGD